MWNDKTITDFWQNNQADFAGDANAKAIVYLTRKYLKGKVLDVGAGSGALVKEIKKVYAVDDVFGVDVAPKHWSVFECSIEDLKENDWFFNVIFATDVLEHLTMETYNKGLEEIWRVLKRGGYFIFTVPYMEDTKQNMVHCPSCQANFHRWGHLQVFDENRIRMDLKRINFKPVKMQVVPLTLIASHWLFKYFWRILAKLNLIHPNELLVVAQKL